jgi:predicted O-methyltransferase YrrM
MCSNARLRGIHSAVKHVVAHNIPGDVVECGTARGGSAALMGLTLQQLGASERTLWVFDTFEGLPPPTADDPDYDIAKLYTGTCLGTIEDVTASFRRLGIYPQAKLVKGLFQDTLPDADIKNIAFLHLDGDWYESVKTCLENLYDKVSEGGVIQIDDYGFWKGAQKAVDEFFASRSIVPRMKRLDYSGRQFIKSE